MLWKHFIQPLKHSLFESLRASDPADVYTDSMYC